MTEASVSLTGWDWGAFALYLLGLSAIGLWAGRRSADTDESEDYFLAGRSLPWYVVGSSYIAANISTEHFIGLIGAAFIYGIAVATGEWSTVIAFMFLIWLFIPFLLRAKVFTAPEFLERRFNPQLRFLFAAVTVIANIVAFLAPVIYGGGLAFSKIIALDQVLGLQAGGNAGLYLMIALIGLLAGGWAIYGGLKSVAWMDVLTIAIMVGGGLLVTMFGLAALGGGDIVAGFGEMLSRNAGKGAEYAAAIVKWAPDIVGSNEYDRLSVIQPLTHQTNPWTHWVFSFFYIGLWYTVINQFLVQRIFAAKDIYHARMGMTFASYLKLLLPFIVVVPGLIWFALNPQILSSAESLDAVRPVADQTYVSMIQTLIPIGIKGVLLAALFGAIQSTVAAVLNSTSTILTLDFYKRFFNPAASEHSLVGLGRIITAVVLALAIGLGIWISTLGESLFVYIQELYTFFAPPFSAIFLLGTLWRRINGTGALWTVILGFAFGIAVKIMVQTGSAPDLLVPYANQGLLNWALCMVLCTLISLATPPPLPAQVTDDLAFNFRKMNLGGGLGGPWYKSVPFWSIGAIVLMFGFMLVFSVLL
ncbi:Sodium/glucose cotransporter [Tsuneonella dongtanensis]|uniref:Sodium/glucose cotransporter n=1 Tax=Tsuneonella dongtanensis TaxID=692370 RepID=A0A1B2AB63_9SPHN|nr:sodium/solute symporter [Tsuneonella dongtanensis]ANY19354.1 Sodium/glucose cotransporter [Tsuneonella dongtanensis]